MTPPNLRKAFHQACRPDEALPPGDNRYVDCNAERHSVTLIDEMEETIRFADGPTCQLLCGHRGCGKTSELLRLQKQLEQVTDGSRYFVVYYETTEFLELSDVDYVDVLISIIHQLWLSSTSQALSPNTGGFEYLLDRVWKFLTQTDVSVKTIGIEQAFAKVGLELKTSPNYRVLVRQHFQQQPSDLMTAVNEIIRSVSAAAEAAGRGTLVIIADNLDRIIRSVTPSVPGDSHERLFVNAAQYLGGLGCHVIYTLPTALRHSRSGPALPTLYRTAQVQMLPMVPVSRQGADLQPDEPGRAVLQEMVRKRANAAGSPLDGIIAAAALDQLCVASGGYVRRLMSLLGSSLLKVRELPITAEAAALAVADVREQFRVSITPSQWKALREVHRLRSVDPLRPDEGDHLFLLENHAVLEYRDDVGVWYDVSPVLWDAPEMRAEPAP